MDDDVECEERTIHLIAVIALAPVVVVALLRHASFDGGTTLCLVGTVLGAIGVLASIIRARRYHHVARARVHAGRSRARRED